VSIVRVGMAENKKYSSGFDAIFAKGKKKTEKPAPAKKPAAKKKAKKK
jgi:hypothetical protein